MFEISRTVVSMSTAGVLVLAAGIAARRRGLTSGSLPDRAIALGRIFVAAPLATFGALHLAAAQGLKGMVPTYLPWPLFWVYIVGFALIATALSLIFDRLVRWSGLLCGAMFLLFVAMLDIPGVIAQQHDRFGFALLARETAFGCGLLALGASAGLRCSSLTRLVTPCRIAFALVALFYGVEHFLHPIARPGVPLQQLMPEWIPGRPVIGYLTGALLVVAGVAMVLDKKARLAATYLGTWIVLLVVFIYGPILIASLADPSAGVEIEGINYFADTMLFAGAILALAKATPRAE